MNNFMASFTIPDGKITSNAQSIPDNTYLANLFIPSGLAGTTISFNGDLGDGTLRPLNFNMPLSDPMFATGNVVTGLQGNFTGLKQVQIVMNAAQTANVTFLGGVVSA